MSGFPPCEGGCILAIVGSRDLEGDLRVDAIIDAVLDTHKPRMVVSGGAKGVDQAGVRVARERGIPVQEFVPKVWAWDVPGGFKERNMQIATACECLVRIYSTTTKTYGSGHCHDYAQKIGRRVSQIQVVREDTFEPQSHQNPTAGHVVTKRTHHP